MKINSPFILFSILLISIVQIPITLNGIPLYANFIAENHVLYFSSLIFATILYWVVILNYFKQKNWKPLLRTSILWSISSLIMLIFILTEIAYGNKVLVTTMAIISVLNITSQILYCVGILAITSNHKLPILKWHGLTTLVAILLGIAQFFQPYLFSPYIYGTLVLLLSLFLILHFIYEQKSEILEPESDDILDL